MTSIREKKAGPRTPALRILSSSVTDAERVLFIRSHITAIKQCGRRTIQHTWLVGRECMYIKVHNKLHGKAWTAFCKDHFGITDRQVRSIMKVYRSFPSLKAIPASVVSLNGALAHPDAGGTRAGAMSRRSAQLRVARSRLTEISKADAAAFRKICAFIRTEHAKLA